MKSLAEWKRQLQPGTQVKQIWNSREGQVAYIFTVTNVQSNGVWATFPEIAPKRSWMSFPKRNEIEFTEHGWIRLEKEGTQKLSEYVWVENGEKQE